MNDKSVQGRWKFSGFAFPTTTQVPDQLFDELLHRLSGAELKVLLYIIRRTFGFKKSSDAISLSQMVRGIKKKNGEVLDKGTGLGKASVVRALNSLVEKKVIIRKRRQSHRKGDEATNYTLNIRNLAPVSQNETPPVPKQNTPVSHLRDTQQTVEQETVRQQQHIHQSGDHSTSNNGALAAALIKKGISKKAAHHLAKSYARERIENNIDWLDWKQKSDPHSIKTNPAGLLRRAIEQNYAAEDHKGFQTRKQKVATSLAKKQRLQAHRRLVKNHEQQQLATVQQYEKERVKRLEMLRETHHTSEKEDSIWSQVLETLKNKMPGVSFKAYLAPCTLLSFQAETALIAVPNQFIKDQIEKRLQKELEQTLGDLLNDQSVAIQCLVVDK